MSSVAKCLVLAGAALEADALLLQTGTQQTECKQKGCSNAAEAVADICALWDAAKAATDDQKKAADSVKANEKEGEKVKKDGKVKFLDKSYTCVKANCKQGGDKADKETKPEDVDKELGAGTTKVKDACAASEADAVTGKGDTPPAKSAQTQCQLMKNIVGAGANDITAVEANSDNPKSIKVTIKNVTDNVYLCEDDKACTVATGEPGKETVGPKQTTIEAKKNTRASEELANKITSLCAK